jgi:hypothetical protein
MKRTDVTIGKHPIEGAKIAHAALKLFLPSSGRAAHRKPPALPGPDMWESAFELRDTIHPDDAGAVRSPCDGHVLPHFGRQMDALCPIRLVPLVMAYDKFESSTIGLKYPLAFV